MESFGEYQLLTKLATGGMAQVFLAQQVGREGFNRLVVLKRILPHLAESKEFVDMFLREARVAARLNHPNIAQVYDLGQKGDNFFIAMEYVHGEDFRRVVKQAVREGRKLPVPLAVRMVIGAAQGLDFAHDQLDLQTGQPLGIVHRDVSPQNLLVTFEGGVKVIDFGIAKAADGSPHTRTGVLKGKYAYMSPEQAEGRSVDRRSDVFALGVILWELVTGQRLFKKPADLATLQAVMACKVPAPSSLNPAIDPGLDDIILRTLAKERDERMPTAGQLQVELEEYLLSHRLPGTTAHLKQFMRELYAERLAREARLGRPWIDGGPVELATSEPPASRPGNTTPSSRSSQPPAPAGTEAATAPALTPATPVTAPSPAPDPSAARKPVALYVPEVQPARPVAAARPVQTSRGSTPALAWILAAVAALAGVAFATGLWRPSAGTRPRATARLRVQSEPKGAEVFIDDRPSGHSTPDVIELEPGKPHALRLEKPGYLPATDNLAAFSGELARTYQLSPRRVGAVQLTTTPAGASIVLDGRATGKVTNAVIPDLEGERDHEAVLSLPGYEDEIVSFRVKVQRTTQVTRALRPRGTPPAPAPAGTKPPAPRPPGDPREPAAAEGTLSLTSSPTGLALEVDGKPAGKTPATLKLAAGPHRLRLTDPARFIDYAGQVTMAAGPQTLAIELAPRQVNFAVQPWAEVDIAGRKFADSPGRAELYPGTYAITYKCPALRAQRTETLVVPAEPGPPLKVVFTLQEGEGAP